MSQSRASRLLRPVKLTKGFLKNAKGSCLVEFGNTKVICAASLEDRVPPFLKGSGRGWLSAEYGMLPASCNERIARESSRGKVSGRTQEIQRLIGRSLRAVVDLEKLGERMIWIDADVLQGDGGTRTASITGAFIALAQLIESLMKEKVLIESPLIDHIAAVSVGIVNKKAISDLCYVEDSSAQVDMNVVMTGSGRFVEIQGTAEGEPFTEKQMSQLIALAKRAIAQLVTRQKKLVKASLVK